jgi:hypothetical protein
MAKKQIIKNSNFNNMFSERLKIGMQKNNNSNNLINADNYKNDYYDSNMDWGQTIGQELGLCDAYDSCFECPHANSCF